MPLRKGSLPPQLGLLGLLRLAKKSNGVFHLPEISQPYFIIWTRGLLWEQFIDHQSVLGAVALLQVDALFAWFSVL